jgi:hypothetical protein
MRITREFKTVTNMASTSEKPHRAYRTKEKDKEWNIVRRRIKEEEESVINYR